MVRVLTTGDLVRCPHCQRWHPVIQRHTSGTDYTIKMLYFECRGGFYFAGSLGTPSRHQTRPARQPSSRAGRTITTAQPNATRLGTDEHQ